MSARNMAMGLGLLLMMTVAMTTVHGFNKYQAVVSDALSAAYSEQISRMQLNQQLVFAGVDSQNSENTYKAMHNMMVPVQNFSQENTMVATKFIRATQIMSQNLKMPLPQMLNNPKLVNAWLSIASKACSPRIVKCPPVPFRSADGSCNNINFPTWGMAFRPQQRWIPAAYADGINTPRMFSVTGKSLPSPRAVSNIIHNSGKTFIPSHHFTSWLMTFGQQITHDVVETPMLKGANGASISCCNIDPKTLSKRSECFPIPIPLPDHKFKRPCMEFVRSSPSTEDSCKFGPRNQANQVSSYLDANFIYGTDIFTQNQLRFFKFGLLKETKFGLFFPEPPAPGRCTLSSPKDYCLKSGDARGHHVPMLMAAHVVFLREHNRIARVLTKLNPHWSDERIFQETRKIVIAIYQHIVYLEYLPKVIGPHLMSKTGLFPVPFGFNTVYNKKKDATQFNAFGAAAFRFGHTQIPATVDLMNLDLTPQMAVPIQNTFNKPALVTMKNGIGAENIVRAMGRSSAFKADRFLDRGVRDYLFMDKQGHSFDLAALNIQRGRDHGIASYTAWRRWCGLKPPMFMGPGPAGLVDMDPEAAILMGKIYKHVDDIDLFTGGLAELPVKGGTVGPTFACLISRQFIDFKTGDRFYYENAFPGVGFTLPQLNAIKKVRMSTLVCNNMKEFTSTPDVFKKLNPMNPELPCKMNLPVNLSFWREMPPKMVVAPPMVAMSKLYH